MEQESSNHQLLTSWKEIALHLGKGVRTVQRWERELGLPVRRPSQSRHIVMAITSELDEWILRLEQPSSKPCCSSQQELEIARQIIADLKKENARLEMELKSALGMGISNVIAMNGAVAAGDSSAGITVRKNVEPDGNAA
jgi:hypothetical protein